LFVLFVLTVAAAESATSLALFVLAHFHFHYVLSMGAVFAMFAAFYYWIEKITGCKYNELLGQIYFRLMFVRVNLTFFPMHFLGLAGMPRGLPDYPDDIYSAYNLISSYGSLGSYIATIFFFYVLYHMLTKKNQKGNLLY
jgi:heme/copper-type cytochrome/quinol oxidase subunit 1